jgi:predicted outer membrane repeat protein
MGSGETQKLWIWFFAVAILVGSSVPGIEAAPVADDAVEESGFMVTSVEDSGAGTLRQAILDANARPGPQVIRFDSETGPFADPQIIRLLEPLPVLTGELTIDGYIDNRLWQATGVTLSGGGEHRVFEIAAGARVTIASLTVAEGRDRTGGGIFNRGDLVVRGVTFRDNEATRRGGGVANKNGQLTVINSTFVGNSAVRSGGGLAGTGGRMTVTNCTFTRNSARKGGGLYFTGTLLMRNTILANSSEGSDCLAKGELDPAGIHNLIVLNEGCGDPISSADPLLGELGSYQGPTRTIPPGGGSAAINLGDNASAVDESGAPLQWDQRGNGDPRYVGGITDIGAFETQAFPDLTVDTVDDVENRACSRAFKGDCSLRGAIALANATAEPDVIRFDPGLFGEPTTIVLDRSLPDLTTDITFDAGGTGGVVVEGPGENGTLRVSSSAEVRFVNLEFRLSEPALSPPGDSAAGSE